jgi:undecaprenyl-diphosphatase
VLAVADPAPGRRPAHEIPVRDAQVMGLAQTAALQPGVTPSGATISASRWLGFDRDAAARLSFLMSLPIIGGAGIYKGLDVASNGLPPGTAAAFAWGTVASAVTGFAAVWLVLRLVRTRSFTPFVVYRVLAGVAVLIVFAAGWR